MEPTSTLWNGKPKIGLGVPMVVKYERSNSSDGPPRICKEEQSLFQFCDGNLNFTTVPSEDDDFSFNKKKALLARDPMSHRIIEKRRRDRMNNCLADLSRLIPAEYLKKGRGRIEKTEIIEMAIKHMKYLQDHPGIIKTDVSDTSQPPPHDDPPPAAPRPAQPCGGGMTEQYRLGYSECLAEAVRFMVDVEGCYAGDHMCVELAGHLQRHCDKLDAGERLIYPQTQATEATNFSTVSTPCFPHHINNNNNNNNHNNNNNNNNRHKFNGINNNDSSFSPNSGDSSSDSRHDPPTPKRVAPPTETPAPSQLRNMLTCPDITSKRVEKNVENRVGGKRDATSHDPTLYKFKNTIKQRFTAEHDVETASKRRRDSDTCSARSSSATSPERRTSTTATRNEVPIFALHARRPYYVPLTLDADALAPFADELNGTAAGEEEGDDEGRQVLLHPVTISVDFLQAWRGGGRRNGAGGANGLNGFGGLDGCLPVPTWHQCQEEEVRGAFAKRLF